MAKEADDALVARAKAGDRDAFAALVERHYAAIHRFAWRRCGDAAEAEDIAQETLIRVARGIDRFEGRSAFLTWCLGVALNAARDAVRARSRREAAMNAFSAMAFVEAAAQDGRPGDSLWDEVSKLPERQRDAILLVHVEGLSHREAAQALGCAEATVSWHVFAARRRLKSALSRAEP